MVKSYQDAVKGRGVIPREQLSRSKYPPFFMFEETGDWLSGVITEPRTINTEFGEAQVVTIKGDTEEDTYSVILTAQLAGLWEMVGKNVVIKFDGITRNKQGGYTKNFTVSA